MHALLRPLCCALLLCATTSVCAVSLPQHDTTLRVMTFNVRYSEGNDGINAWPNRRDLAVKTILERRPALLGTQELLLPQARYFADHLPGYAWFGRGRNGNEIDKDDNEHMGVFYDTNRLKLLESGDFWLSSTPDVPGSKDFGQALPRMASWAHFEDRRSGRRFYYFDTHFPYKADAEAIRERCAALLQQRIGALPAGEPVILTGDFNTTPDRDAHALLTRTLHDAWSASQTQVGPESTFHGFTGTPTKRIDWILFRGLDVTRVETVTDHQGAVYPSDHYPVVADFSFQPRQ